jgi:putative autotransporter adhesin-like protein
MKLFFGILIGLVLAVGIAGGAAYMAFGDITDIGARDKTNDITRSYELAGFNEIDIGGVYEVDIRVGPEFSVTLSGAEDEIARADVAVERGILHLTQEETRRGKHRWRNMGLTAEITLPALNAIEVAGVADVDVEGVAADDFTVRLAGVGEIDVAGTCNALTASLSGVGELDAADLECADVDVRVSGVGEASVYASRSVDARVGGIGAITIYGSPARVEKSSSFLADIKVK